MKTLLLMLTLFYVSKVLSKYSVKKLENIEGNVKKIYCNTNYFDYHCYIWTEENIVSRFYKINLEKEVVFMEEYANIIAMFVDNENEDAYFLQKQPHRNVNDFVIWKWKSSWTEFKKMHGHIMHKNKTLKFLMDEDNYLYFNTELGPVLLKGKRNVPIALSINLTKYDFDSFETDSKKNVYLRIKIPGNTLDWIFLLPKKAKNAKFPTAERIQIDMSGDPSSSVLDSIGMSSSRGVYFATSKTDTKQSTAYITKLVEKKLELVHAQYNSKFHFFCTTSDRLYFTNKDAYVYFIDNDDEVTAITPFKKRPSLEKDKCKEDSKGNVYIPFKKSILKIAKGKTTVTKIVTPSNKKISSIFINHNDDIWAMGEDLYYFSSHDLKAVTVPNMNIDEDSSMEENTKKSEMLIGTKTGLFSVFEEKSYRERVEL